METLKNHIYCNHAPKFELFPNASFGTSNNFVCEHCTSSSDLLRQWRNILIPYMHLKPEHPQRQVWDFNCFKCKIWIKSWNTLETHVYCVHAPQLGTLRIACRALLIKTIQIDFMKIQISAPLQVCAIFVLTNIAFVVQMHGSFEKLTKNQHPLRVCIFVWIHFFKNFVGEHSSNPKISPTLLF